METPPATVASFLEQHKGDFEKLPSGRIRCVLTGHEILPSVKSLSAHLDNKRYKAAKRDENLKKFQPHIIQSPEYKDKLLCTLTGVALSKKEEAVWQHMLGKKFTKALAAKEAEAAAKKKTTTIAADGDDIEMVVCEPPPEKTKTNKAKRPEAVEPLANGEAAQQSQPGEDKPRKDINRNKRSGKSTDGAAVKVGIVGLSNREVRGGEEGEGDEPEFWVPSPGDRWDGDTGGARWGEPEDDAMADEDDSRGGKEKDENSSGAEGVQDGDSDEDDENADKRGNGRDADGDADMNGGGVPGQHEKLDDSSDDEDFFGRRPSELKREAHSAVGPRFNAPPKKKKRRP